MILDLTTLSLQAVLAGAVTDNQPEVHVFYQQYNTDGAVARPATYRSAMNSATDVTILPAPATAGQVKEVLGLSIYNKDTASVTVTVKTDDGTTERIVTKATLATLETLFYEKNEGWYAITTAGARK